MKAHLDAIGLLAPGLEGWANAGSILRGEQGYRPQPLQAPTADALPPAERRRTGLQVKLALGVGRECLDAAGRAAGTVATVFASSGGDGEVIHELCRTLATPQRELSPTRFHNSVHNAPAGYWGIATHSTAPSISVACFDSTVAAGLVEAAAQLAGGIEDVLVICCDVPYPEPLAAARPMTAPFACALLLSREARPGRLGELRLAIEPDGMETTLGDPPLERLRLGNPAARSLPLLAAFAARRATPVSLAYLSGQQLRLDVAPC